MIEPEELTDTVTPLLVRMPSALHQRLKIAAAQEGRSMTELVVDALEAWLDRITTKESEQ